MIPILLLFQNVGASNKGSFICSPLSAQITLAFTAEGAVCDTKSELLKALYLSNEEKTEKSIAGLNLSRSSDNLTVQSSNKLYLGDKFKLEQRFQEVARDYYKAGTQNLNFCNNAKSADTINNWVAQNTNNKILNLIPSNALSCSTRLVLVNTLYFKAVWKVQFDVKYTYKEKFYPTCCSGNEIDMMHSNDRSFKTYKFYRSTILNAKFLQLEYSSGYSMTFILHDQCDGLAEIESKLEEYLKPQNMANERVSITLPKFTITTSINFVPILQKVS